MKEETKTSVDIVIPVDLNDGETEVDYISADVEIKGVHKKSCLGVTLRWKGISLEVQMKDDLTKEMKTKVILNNISGMAKPGEFIAIMGPSGAGKSSLLDCLAGRNTNGKGTVTINGEPWSKKNSRVCSYVLQDDVFYGTLTVQEHLRFQCKLRMGDKVSAEEREHRVAQVITELGLNKCKDTMIGNARVRGISGGERKRLSVATELLTNPSIFFVDEPTSGLDSFMAEAVVTKLQQLAKEGRTVLATVHQPSSYMMTMFDKLLLVSEGQLIYHDLTTEAVPYFAQQGMECPQYTNPSDFFMRQLVPVKDTDQVKIQKLAQAWKLTEAAKETHEASEGRTEREKTELVALTLDSSPLNIFVQLAVLANRNVTRLRKDKISFYARVGQNVILAMIISLIYLQLDIDQKGVQNFSGALFFLTVNRLFGDASPEFVNLPLEFPIVGSFFYSTFFEVFLKRMICRFYANIEVDFIISRVGISRKI